jgi:hypothetical protein
MSGLEEGKGKTTASEDLSQLVDRCPCIEWLGPWTYTAFYLRAPCLLVLMRQKETASLRLIMIRSSFTLLFRGANI